MQSIYEVSAEEDSLRSPGKAPAARWSSDDQESNAQLLRRAEAPEAAANRRTCFAVFERSSPMVSRATGARPPERVCATAPKADPHRRRT